MRSGAALFAALVVGSESGHGLEVPLCDVDGEQPVQVRGLSGIFCVSQQLCEGFLSDTSDQMLACPRAGQQDVVGNEVLAHDSCCGVVDSNSGKLGCVQKNETLMACPLWPLEREYAPIERKSRRNRALQSSVTSEVIFTILVAPPMPMDNSVAPGLTKRVPTTVAPVITIPAPTEAPEAPVPATQFPATTTKGPVSAPLNPEALRIEAPLFTQDAPVAITQASVYLPETIAPTIEDPLLTTLVPSATVGDQGTHISVSTSGDLSSAAQVAEYTTESPALTPAAIAPIATTGSFVAAQKASTATTTPTDTAASMIRNELLTTANSPTTIVTPPTDNSGAYPELTNASTVAMSNLQGTLATNTIMNASVSPTATLISSPPAASVVSTTLPIDTYVLPAGGGLTPPTETFNENISTSVIAAETSETLTTFPTTELPISATLFPRPTDSVFNSSNLTESTSSTTIQTALNASAISPSLDEPNLPSGPISSQPVAAIPVFNSSPSIESIVPQSTLSPSQVRPSLETIMPLTEPSAESDSATPIRTSAQPLAPAMLSSHFIPLEPSKSSSDGLDSDGADERPSGCSLRAPNCLSGTITNEPTESLLTSEPSSSITGSTRARHDGANTAGSSFSSKDYKASSDVVQLSPIIDDSSTAPTADGSRTAASNGNIGGSSVLANTVTYIIVGSAATIAVVFGIFYLRPRRVNPLEQITPLEPLPPLDRSGDYWYDRSLESELVGSYDASSTPREMSASI